MDTDFLRSIQIFKLLHGGPTVRSSFSRVFPQTRLPFYTTFGRQYPRGVKRPGQFDIFELSDLPS